MRTKPVISRACPALTAIALTLLAVARAQGQPAPLDWVNAWRDAAHLPPVSENAAWSAGAVAHSRYCVKNGILTHDEDPARPFYTPEGDAAGNNGNVAAHSSATVSPLWAIDAWITGPFHALGILDPRLAQVGYGVYQESGAGGWIGSAATLDVLRGRSRPGPYPYPVRFPGDGAVVPYPRGCSGGACYSGNESPQPLTSCPGYTAPTGLPIVLQVGTGSITPVVTASSFARDGVPMPHCVFTEATYTNPSPGDQSLGRAVLGSRDAVVLIPRSPLPAGSTYAVSLTVNGTTHAWSFGVVASGTPSGAGAPPPPPTDADGDGLPDVWEQQFGLDASSGAGADGPAGDPDGDGVTNAAEHAGGTHPRGTFVRYLAEGSTSTFFATRLALLNPGSTAARVNLRFLRSLDGPTSRPLTVNARSRATVDVETLPGLAQADFATIVEADAPIVVDRTMRWDAGGSYGAHADTAVRAPLLTWYLAEGATHSGFDLFYLLQNPSTTPARVRVRYLLPSGAPCEKTYDLDPLSRRNIWVNAETFGASGRLLASTDVSAVIESLDGVPIIVERAMYRTAAGRTFDAGHESAGVTTLSPTWFFAEGATGPYFDLFLLIANPSDRPVPVRVTYLLPGGATVGKTHDVGPNSRFNIWVDGEDPRLANAAVSAIVESIDGTPFIAERAMWWPGGAASWHEAHNAPGATGTGTQWALADGEVGGSRGIATYVLVANASSFAGSARVTLFFENGTTADRTYTIAANSRTNVDVGRDFPQAAGLRFGTVVESLGTTPARIVVERAMYWNAGGTAWAAGTGALATLLR